MTSHDPDDLSDQGRVIERIFMGERRRRISKDGRTMREALDREKGRYGKRDGERNGCAQ